MEDRAVLKHGVSVLWDNIVSMMMICGVSHDTHISTRS